MRSLPPRETPHLVVVLTIATIVALAYCACAATVLSVRKGCTARKPPHDQQTQHRTNCRSSKTCLKLRLWMLRLHLLTLRRPLERPETDGLRQPANSPGSLTTASPKTTDTSEGLCTTSTPHPHKSKHPSKHSWKPLLSFHECSDTAAVVQRDFPLGELPTSAEFCDCRLDG